MTTTPCDLVAERLALGEPMADLTDHVATCERCQAVIDLPARLGATRTPIDPGLGFSARMTAGAQHRIGVRRRRRVAAGIAGSMAAAVAVVFLVTRAPTPNSSSVAAQDPAVQVDAKTEDPWNPTPPMADDDLAALVRLADTKRSRRLSAHWAKIQRPLAPYRDLVKGTQVTP